MFHKPTHRTSTCFDEIGFDCVETRRVPPFLPSVDVSKHVHNTFDGFHKPTSRKSTCIDQLGVDYNENTKATSIRRVPTVLQHPSTFQPVVDVSNRVYKSTNTSHSLMHRELSHFDEVGFGCIEHTKDTFLRHVPTFQPAVDASNCVHNSSNTSLNLMRRTSLCFNETPIIYTENTKDMSY